MLDVPQGWTVSTERGRAYYTPPDHSLRVTVHPLVDHALADLRRVIGLAPGHVVNELVTTAPRRANAGWEIRAAIARVVDDAGVLVETHRIAIYHVLWMVAFVIVVGRGDDVEREAELDALLVSGRPQLWAADPASALECR